MINKDLSSRFWLMVDIQGSNECWPWMGNQDGNGYGQFWISRENPITAHRFAYTDAIGSIPDGLTIDHLCRNRSCENPSHLEAVSRGINVLRGEGLAARNARKTHCIRSHPFSGSNLRISPQGIRECRACCRIRSRKSARLPSSKKKRKDSDVRRLLSARKDAEE